MNTSDSPSAWQAEQLSQLDHAILSAFEQHPEGFSLFELIKFLSTAPIQIFDERPLADPQGLFQTNFVVMNALYRLNNQDTRFNYEIHSVKIIRHLRQKCEAKKSEQTLTWEDPLAKYYLDWNNFNQTDQAINDLLNQFWEKVLIQEFEEEDLAILNLSRPTTIAEIKKRYRSLSQQHHPDKGGDAEHYIEIQTAYQRLTKGQ